MWITRVSINNPVFAAMVMVAICVLGIFSYSRLGVEQMRQPVLPGEKSAMAGIGCIGKDEDIAGPGLG